MVIANLIGGLGNQMFQYAAAKALALLKNTPLSLDTTSFESYTLHQGFELDRIFSGDFRIAHATDTKRVLRWQSSPRIKNILNRSKLSWLRANNLIIEPTFEYWSGIKNSPNECYLMGYWQSERYFEEFSEEIRRDFVFKTDMNAQNIETADLISDRNAISLHVRRGDYVNNSVYSACSIEYYQAAIEHLSKKIETPEFFIFSDDIEWVKKHLPVNFPHYYVDYNKGAESYNDMRLMSMCKHHIIANSSFSWWGAWLNPKNDKLIVAPKRWFANDTNVQDLFPSDWVKL
jgi:hypothetical protein